MGMASVVNVNAGAGLELFISYLVVVVVVVAIFCRSYAVGLILVLKVRNIVLGMARQWFVIGREGGGIEWGYVLLFFVAIAYLCYHFLREGWGGLDMSDFDGGTSDRACGCIFFIYLLF